MRRLLSSTPAQAANLRALKLAVAPDGRSLQLEFADGFEARYHALWLRDNCPSRRNASNQKALTPASVPAASMLANAAISDGGDRVTMSWADQGADAATSFDVPWLREHAHSFLSPAVFSHAPNAPRRPLPRISCDAVLDGASTEGLWKWVSHIAETGVCIVDGVPDSADAVCALAERIAPVMPTIYGRAWDVIDQPNAINVAYTSGALGLHQDLAYYESPPGLQFLHCRQFDACVSGGESVLVDVVEAAELLAIEEPDAFETLARVPATFMKEHHARERPVSMRYRRPHIVRAAGGGVSACFWSPPFEGPLQAPLEDVEPYYRAYALFERLIGRLEDERGWVYRLQPGEMLAFSNRRLAHGRRGYESNGGTRLLRGCYVNIDEFVNAYNVLWHAHGSAEAKGENPAVKGIARVGNQDAANVWRPGATGVTIANGG